jgi:hypothetical protein
MIDLLFANIVSRFAWIEFNRTPAVMTKKD